MSIENLIKKQKELPEKIGVYSFIGKNNSVLYVGKAKNLKKRTKYYFKEKDIPQRLKKIVFEAIDIIYYITENENEAFLLEAQMIKEKQPKYNIQYKNGRSLSYIIFSNHIFPRFEIQKKWQEEAIGPFLSYLEIKNLTQDLLSIFKLRTCSDFAFKRRFRPCLEYYAKRCTAPCFQLITEDEYAKNLNLMKDLFKGKTNQVVNLLMKTLKQHIKNENFEEAAKINHNISLIHKLKEKQGIFFDKIKNLDIALTYENCFYLESIKNGAIVNIEYRKYDKKIDLEEALFNYYDENKVKIIGFDSVNFPNYTNILSIEEKKVIQHTQNRFKNLIKEDAQKHKWAEILNLKILNTIEAYDCSHYNSKFALCGMIKGNIEGEFFKKEYKIFKINKNSYNDLEILYNGLIQRGIKNLPDLIIIDGGKTQLNIAQQALAPFKNIIAFAKDENRRSGIIYHKENEILEIQDQDLILFLENFRTEAHNWSKNNAKYRYTTTMTKNANN